MPDDTTAVPDDVDVGVNPDVGVDTDGGTGDDAPLQMTQAEFDQKLGSRIGRERAQWEKSLKKLFGTADLKSAGEYYKAGQAVAQKTGRPPGEIVTRLSGNPVVGNVQPAQEDVTRHIDEIKNMLMEKHEQEARDIQSKEAKKEFGSLYDQYETDIQDLAEERGLPLTDAAAVVLRPHLAKHYETRAQKQRELLKGKRVDATDGGPTSKSDATSKLTPKMVEAARGFGIDPKKYAERAKKAGLIE